MKKITIISIILLSIILLFSCRKEELNRINNSNSEAQFMEGEGESEMPLVNSPFPYCNENPNPIGGGAGYNNIISINRPHSYFISSPDPLNFINTIQNAVNGDVVFIDPNLSIDLSNMFINYGQKSIYVQAGVTIASNRGESGSSGALIYTNDMTNFDQNILAPVFLIKGDNVRITGIRLKGPSGNVGPMDKRGIATYEFDHLKIDNCEIYNFPGYAISIGHSSFSSLINNEIIYNYIHNNQKEGLGYGVVLNRGYAKIFGNLFKNNRHDIAGSGVPECGYEAGCNTVLKGRVYNFDMHSEGGEDPDGPDPNNEKENAGKFIFIHHNDFLGTYDNVENKHDYNIGIRGRPDVQCRIENNRFKHDGPSQAIAQGMYRARTKSFGNMLVWNNIYNSDTYKGWYVKSTWHQNSANNFMNVYSQNSNSKLNIYELNSTPNLLLYIEDTRIIMPQVPLLQGAINNSTYYSLNFGDFDGDGNTDIFKLDNGKLYTIPYDAHTYGYNADWQLIASTSYLMSDLRFGFFDGDNRTDMIVKNGTDLMISSGCNSSWAPRLTTSYSFDQLHFGDFLGDGQTDLFLADGVNFQYSNDASSTWSTLATSSYSEFDLLLGRFNSNNKSDVFLGDGTDFLASYEGVSSWSYLCTSGYQVFNNKLQSFDFNGDNRSDILNDVFQVSLYGTNSWITTNTGNFPISTFPYGDF